MTRWATDHFFGGFIDVEIVVAVHEFQSTQQ
jgi:hypothetical protein